MGKCERDNCQGSSTEVPIWRTQDLVPLPINDIVFSKSFSFLEAGTTAFLKRPRYKSQDLFLEVALAIFLTCATWESFPVNGTEKC